MRSRFNNGSHETQFICSDIRLKLAVYPNLFCSSIRMDIYLSSNFQRMSSERFSRAGLLVAALAILAPGSWAWSHIPGGELSKKLSETETSLVACKFLFPPSQRPCLENRHPKLTCRRSRYRRCTSLHVQEVRSRFIAHADASKIAI
jgi:hypothetical protein